MEHIHGPNCGCKDYLGIENANDLLGSIDIEKVKSLIPRFAVSTRSTTRRADTSSESTTTASRKKTRLYRSVTAKYF